MCWRVENGEWHFQLYRRCHESKSRKRVRGYFENSRRATSNDCARSSVRGACFNERKVRPANVNQRADEPAHINSGRATARSWRCELLQETPFCPEHLAGGIIGHHVAIGKLSVAIKVFNESADGRRESVKLLDLGIGRLQELLELY